MVIADLVDLANNASAELSLGVSIESRKRKARSLVGSELTLLSLGQGRLAVIKKLADSEGDCIELGEGLYLTPDGEDLIRVELFIEYNDIKFYPKKVSLTEGGYILRGRLDLGIAQQRNARILFSYNPPHVYYYEDINEEGI